MAQFNTPINETFNAGEDPNRGLGLPYFAFSDSGRDVCSHILAQIKPQTHVESVRTRSLKSASIWNLNLVIKDGLLNRGKFCSWAKRRESLVSDTTSSRWTTHTCYHDCLRAAESSASCGA